MSEPDTDLDALLDEIDQNQQARCAGRENAIRRILAKQINLERQARGWTVEELARQAGVSRPQTLRALYLEVGSNLMLSTIVRIADVLGIDIVVKISSKEPT
jgi:AraC-like DNA-binding protein